MANSYQEIQSAPVPMDGTQTVFMLTTEPIFYVVSIINGQKFIQGYTFTELTAENRPKSPPTVEDRLSILESNIAKITSILEGGKGNESNIQTEPAG